MTWPIELQLPYPVSVNRYWRMQSVRRKGGASCVIPMPTSDGKQYKADVQTIAAHARVRPIIGPVEYELELYPNLPQDWRKRAKTNPLWWDMTVQCLDLDNARKVLLDALNGIAWTDDSWIVHDRAWRMPPEGRAHCILRVRPFERKAAPLPREANLALDIPLAPQHRRELATEPAPHIKRVPALEDTPF